MTNEEIVENFTKLENSHKTNRWVNAAIALFLLVFGFYLIGDSELGYQDNFSLGNVMSPIGGIYLGFIIANWSGSKSHKLLKSVVGKVGKGGL